MQEPRTDVEKRLEKIEKEWAEVKEALYQTFQPDFWRGSPMHKSVKKFLAEGHFGLK